jgi:hypothetical protein
MTTPLASRLQLKPGERIAVLEAPAEAPDLLEGVDLAEGRRADGVLAFARDIALDETWSALRFRRAEDVGSRAG